MAQYEAPPFRPGPDDAPERSRKWPLAGVMAIDFVLAMLAFLGLTLATQLALVAIRAAQLGLSLNAPS